jgi:hypothetical protein
MKDIKYCDCCGAKMVEYTHMLNLPLLTALLKLYNAGHGEHHLRDLNLTYSERCNFQKLRYWGLVERREGGRWEMTMHGRFFARGEVRVPRAVQTYRAKTVRYSMLELHITEVTDGRWKQRIEWAEESVPHREAS